MGNYLDWQKNSYAFSEIHVNAGMEYALACRSLCPHYSPYLHFPFPISSFIER